VTSPTTLSSFGCNRHQTTRAGHTLTAILRDTLTTRHKRKERHFKLENVSIALKFLRANKVTITAEVRDHHPLR
jgi:pterin-4a-carbinolamine dehydratase